jgi:hypothetical protein
LNSEFNGFAQKVGEADKSEPEAIATGSSLITEATVDGETPGFFLPTRTRSLLLPVLIPLREALHSTFCPKPYSIQVGEAED